MDTWNWRIIGLLALVWSSTSSGWAAETIRIGGNGSSMPLLQQLGDLFHKSHPEIEVAIMNPPIGSLGSMRALAAGQLDLAVSAKLPKPADRAKIAAPIPWVITPIVLAGRDVKKVSFSRQQLADIYTGQLKQWPDGSPIRLMLRSSDVSDTDKIKALSPQLDAAVSQALLRNTQPVGGDALESLKILERTPNSLGSTTLGLILSTRSPIKPVAIDGVMPSVKTMQDGSYPLSKQLILFTAKTPSRSVVEFIEFLRSPTASQYMRRLEYIPVTP
jgi:phosphate transport system substrate-binding protein